MNYTRVILICPYRPTPLAWVLKCGSVVTRPTGLFIVNSFIYMRTK